MKRTVFALALMVGRSFAQPTMNTADLTMVVGEKFHMVNFAEGSPGNGGNNQTWNFGNINPSDIMDTAVYEVVLPNSTPFAQEFSNAALSLKGDGYYQFYKTGSTLSLMGYGFSDDDGKASSVFSDMRQLLTFPITTNTDFRDTYKGSSTFSGITMEDRGKIHVYADGWGTIITPSGTFSNTIRLVTEDTLMRITSFFGMKDTTFTIAISYQWFKAGYHTAIFSIDEVTEDLDTKITGSYLMTNVVASVKDNKTTNEYKIYPNPLQNELFIEPTAHTTEKAHSFNLYNHSGQLLKTAKPENGTTHSFDTSGLSAGVYMIEILSGNDRYVRKVVKQ